jgi:DNA-binding GntR family transcriptional regulator
MAPSFLLTWLDLVPNLVYREAMTPALNAETVSTLAQSAGALTGEPTQLAQATQWLREAILRGDIRPGAPLPEIPLSKQLAISRGTLREAFRILGKESLVEIVPVRGARVAALSPRDVREVFSLRAHLECFGIRLSLSTGRFGAEGVIAAEQAFENMVACAKSDDVAASIETDMAFHWALSARCNHRLLLDQLAGLQTRTRQMIFLTKSYRSDTVDDVESHLPILQAVRARDAVQAETCLHRHIIQTGENLLLRMAEDALR